MSRSEDSDTTSVSTPSMRGEDSDVEGDPTLEQMTMSIEEELDLLLGMSDGELEIDEETFETWDKLQSGWREYIRDISARES